MSLCFVGMGETENIFLSVSIIDDEDLTAAEQNSIASALVSNLCEKQTIQIISKYSGEARVSEGDVLQQYPLGDDLLSSPLEALASLLSLPIIFTKLIVETESPNDHERAKRQKSQMLKDDHDVEPQDEAQDSCITKYSDQATTSESQKR
ncbi:MAG: hypothetical protein EZS28_003920 [Streblomastix strix]|uniref:Uncharacterized protein n=1 Tax=Streblomastix strix TaxID=222440 RepID=A0A5J4WZV1_9EUKA|nr:MAG: hypothetical protein EZS28_003920 [Streblomastix strix]